MNLDHWNENQNSIVMHLKYSKTKKKTYSIRFQGHICKISNPIFKGLGKMVDDIFLHNLDDGFMKYIYHL